MTWEEAVAFALSLPGTEASTSYGQPAVKVAANGRAFLNRGHEADTSFVLAMDLDTIELLKETDPARRKQLLDQFHASGKARITRAGPACSSVTRVRTRSGCAS